MWQTDKMGKSDNRSWNLVHSDLVPNGSLSPSSDKVACKITWSYLL
jgi:hypothetical protein